MSVGSDIDLTLNIPLNISKGIASNKGAVSDMEMKIAEDGRWHLTGKCVAKGAVKIPLTVNGKKYTCKLKAK